MDMAGNAADEVVKISLNATEVALRIAGEGAKEMAILLYTILSQQKKTKGKARLESMLRSEKELKVFAVKEEDLKTFAAEAKRYGVLYCILRNSKGAPDSLCDIMVRAEDAAKINRIVERFQLATVDTASIRRDIEDHRSRKVTQERDVEKVKRNEKKIMGKEQSEQESTNQKAAELLDDLLDTKEAVDKPIQKPEKVRMVAGEKEGNRLGPEAEKEPLSGPISEKLRDTETGSMKIDLKKRSVHKELEDIKTARRQKNGGELAKTKIQYRSPRGSRQRQRVRERHK